MPAEVAPQAHAATANRASPKPPSAAAKAQALAMLRASQAPLRQRDFLLAGIHQEQVARLANAGVIERIRRGHYQLPGAGTVRS